MAAPIAITTILLSEKRRFSGQVFGSSFKTCSRRMQQISDLPVGEVAQLKRHIQFNPSSWSIAALCRQAELADADVSAWLRADPIYLQAEMAGARMMAWDNLALSTHEQDQIYLALQPVFADYGFELSTSQHGFFYMKVLQDASIPDFADAAGMLGCDLAEHLPNDKKWLALFNECQIILHNHVLNVARAEKQLTPINGLWFWGQGILPADVEHPFNKIFTDDFTLSALLSLPHINSEHVAEHRLIDARKVRDWQQIEGLFDARHEYLFDFSDGTQWHWHPSMQWYFWRRQSLHFS